MKLAILILPVLAVLAAAQEPPVNSPVHLESVSADAAQGEVHIAIDFSAPVGSSAHIVVRDKSLILDLTGITYEQSEKRLVINRNGVEDVWVSVHQQDPPLTRITVRLSRLQPYVLSREGKRISLHIGAAAKANSRQQGSGTIPTARAGGVARVLRRAPKPPPFELPQTNSAQNEPPSVPLPPINFSGTAPTERGTGAASHETSASHSNVALASVQQPLPLARVAPPALIRTADLAAPPVAEPVTNMAEAPLARTPLSAIEVRAAPAVPNPDLRTVFHVKFVQQDAAYIDAGRNEGIAEGMKLVVVNAAPNAAGTNNASPAAVVAELTVVGIAETSAVTEIHVPQRDVVPGDLAYLSDVDLQALVQQHSLSATRKYPAVISFTDDDDALDEEARALDVPRPALPSFCVPYRSAFDRGTTHKG